MAWQAVGARHQPGAVYQTYEFALGALTARAEGTKAAEPKPSAAACAQTPKLTSDDTLGLGHRCPWSQATRLGNHLGWLAFPVTVTGQLRPDVPGGAALGRAGRCP